MRTAEFLWQEGHTAHATADEAQAEATKMLDVYRDFQRNFLALHGICGAKPAHERFAGAIDTLTIEQMMQDGKALQSCTSHFLGQNFGKAFDVTFTTKDNTQEYARATSRGLSTRALGGMIMVHSDDKGLVLPPAIAPLHVIIIPLAKTDEDLTAIKTYIEPIIEMLDKEYLKFPSAYFDQSLEYRYKIDDDQTKGLGWKCTQYELQGVPLRLVIGKKEMEAGKIEVYHRDTGEKELVDMDTLLIHLDKYLYSMQNRMLERHEVFTKNHTYEVATYDELKKKITDGFVIADRDGTTETADRIKDETSATIRCRADNNEQNKIGN